MIEAVFPVTPQNQNDLPLVSVLIPCYNGAAFLSAAIESVLTQSYPNIEIIVVNDGSTDNTAHILEGYGDTVTAIHQPNRGLAAARNTGLRSAHGDLIALFDADDICHPERLSAQVACMLQLPDVVLCSSDFSAFSGDRILAPSHCATYYSAISTMTGGLSALYPDKHLLDIAFLKWPIELPHERIEVLSGHIYESLVWGNFIHPPTVMVRRTAISIGGEFDETITNGTDYDWFLRISRLGTAAYVDKPLLKYRYSEGQLSSPKNTARLALDAVISMNKLQRSDAAFVQRHWIEFQLRIGRCYLRAANASVEQDKWLSCVYLVKSISHGVLTPVSIKVLIKLLLPRGVLNIYRRLQKKPQETPSSHI